MRFTKSLAEPVVVLLTNNPEKSQKLFCKLFGTKSLLVESNRNFVNDKLSQTLKSHHASSIDDKGCIFHFLSTRDKPKDTSLNHELSLLSIVDVEEKSANSMNSLQRARDFLATRIEKGTNSFLLRLKLIYFNAMGRTLTAEDLFGTNDVLIERMTMVKKGQSSSAKDESDNTSDVQNTMNPKHLREVVLPYDPDHSSLMSRLENLSCSLIKTGLYKFGNYLAIRPLPISSIDLNLSPPTLVFHCQSFDQVEKELKEETELDSESPIRLHKVGRNSTNQGQLLIGSNALKGSLELRYCQSTDFSSFFAEAQTSLMASSLEDLQNVNVLLEGGQVKNTVSKTTDKELQHVSKLDAMNGLGDCWKEFRVNIQRPWGFLKGTKYKRVAKAPDIPFE